MYIEAEVERGCFNTQSTPPPYAPVGCGKTSCSCIVIHTYVQAQPFYLIRTQFFFHNLVMCFLVCLAIPISLHYPMCACTAGGRMFGLSICQFVSFILGLFGHQESAQGLLIHVTGRSGEKSSV